MRVALIVMAMLAAVSVCACGGPGPSAEQRRSAADELNQSGHPYVGPAGIRASGPPADNNIQAPLTCHLEGPGTVCGRQD
ncbi:hypothetical protein [Lichenicoccus roseus]|uniref:Lipoprotein n=1 Tax=Lichenicoccus roseus TaxID=2683649 RepID=A0A5R9J5N1_9PROT|nr:hypothetical protein [Lichenicoccus roseus]TLU70921.1 hypothetical protein FE263_18845 [Lichenicoccus roseus]